MQVRRQRLAPHGCCHTPARSVGRVVQQRQHAACGGVCGLHHVNNSSMLQQQALQQRHRVAAASCGSSSGCGAQRRRSAPATRAAANSSSHGASSNGASSSSASSEQWTGLAGAAGAAAGAAAHGGGGLFKGAAASVSVASADEEAVAAAESGQGQGQGQLLMPRHWNEQIRTAPLGRRRVLQRYVAQVATINALEPAMRALSDTQLAEQTLRFRAALQDNTHRLPAALDELLPEAFATAREASRRVLGMRHFDSQLVGGMVLHEGQIAEMATGEGKTLVAVLAAYLNALPATLHNPPMCAAGAADASSRGSPGGSSRSSGAQQQQQQQQQQPQPRVGGVHVVTVNDYLAARDAEWMGKVYRFLGLTVGAVQGNTSIEAAQAAYACHVTYVTGQELCFNYLKDNTALAASELMLPSQLGYAIVDEVDSILIDESRNPMIISQPRGDNGHLVVTVDRAVRRLWERITAATEAAVSRAAAATADNAAAAPAAAAAVEAEVKRRYLVLDQKQRGLSLSQEGMALLFSYMLQEPGIQFRAAAREGREPCIMDLWEDDVPWGSMAITALKAYQYYRCGVQYIVRDCAVVIVDESTGRVRPISRYSGGLHQAIEAKEGVAVKPDSHATASITFQVFFRFYRKLSGMTGTAKSAAAEFYEIYGLRVVPIPTNKPPRRKDLPLRLYYTEKDKLAYIVSVVESCWAAGRPVLIGTSTVNESEVVLRVLQDWAGPGFRGRLASRVQLLNAKPENVRLEAQVVAQAGLPSAITIATNMAGRGTDIILGGNPQGLARMGLLRLVYRRLIPGLTPAPAAAGGAEAAAAASELDRLCPAMPLEVFGVYDVPEVSQIRPRSPGEAASGLPRDLHLALLAAMMLAQTAGTGLQGQHGVSHDDLRQLASAALSAADVVRRTTLRRLRDIFGHARLQDLDFSVVVAPKAEAVFDELLDSLAPYYTGDNAAAAPAAEAEGREEGQPPAGSSAGVFGQLGRALEPLQKHVAKAALLLWLWFDQQCESMAEQVVAAGGLLVLGTSLQEGQRIELQLRGRAGRQGDPGTTQLLFDVGDPMIVNYGMQSFQQLAGGLLASGQLLPYQESVVVDMLHKEIQRSMENQWQMARLETKRYDEVLEVYRQNLYSLRRLILTGDSQQRTYVMHMFIQQWVDEQVAALIDAEQGPRAWTAETLDAAAALDGAAGAGGVAPAAASGHSSSGKVSPLGALLWRIHRLVNPPELVNKLQVEFKTLVDGVAYDTTAQALLQLQLQQQQQAAGGGGGGGRVPPLQQPQQQQAQRLATVPLQVSEVAVLSRAQTQQLAGYLVQSQPLTWPTPQFQVGFKTQLALAAHAKLFGTPAAAAAAAGPRSSSSSSNSSSSDGAVSKGGQQQQQQQQVVVQLPEEVCLPQGVLATQRPLVKGRYAAKVCVLRNYLGTALVHAYELRHLTLKRLLVAQSAAAAGAAGGSSGMLDLDSDLYLQTYCRSVMLEWVDALWSCFLEDVDKMRHAVGLKAYSSQQPLDEFRLEANREFLLLLSTYRDAVVARLMVPDLNFSLLLGQQQAEELVGAEVATGADAAATAAQQAGQQQQQQQGQQAPVGAQQQPSPQQAAAVGAVPVNGSSSSNGHAAAQPQPSPAGNKAPAATSAGNTSSS